MARDGGTWADDQGVACRPSTIRATPEKRVASLAELRMKAAGGKYLEGYGNPTELPAQETRKPGPENQGALIRLEAIQG
jgi:hypothetical protein